MKQKSVFAVIGVVAVFAVGIILPKINSIFYPHQITTEEIKFTNATEQIASSETNNSSMAETCGMQFSFDGTNYCFGVPFTPTPITKKECGQISEIKNCHYDRDYWAGAYKQCKDEGKRLPTSNELKALASYLCKTNVPYNGETCTYTEVTMDTTNLNNLSKILSAAYSSNKHFALWSGVENSEFDAWYRGFGTYDTNYYATNRHYPVLFGVCVQ